MNISQKIRFEVFLFLKRIDYLKQKIYQSPRYKSTKEAISYLSSPDCQIPDEDKLVIRKYLSTNLITQISYPFANEYLLRKVTVLFDDRASLSYVIHNGRKLYFKKTMTEAEIKSSYNILCLEQDTRSPHSYKSFDTYYTSADIAIDAGAAEGIWSLDIVEKVGELYLFECDDEWIEALQATFEPWKHKVHIVKKYISDVTDGENIRLDDYFLEKGVYPTILKADIEGAEISLTAGAPELLDKYLKRVILCTYHRESDYTDLSAILQGHHFTTQASHGYMIVIYKADGGYYFDNIAQRIRKALVFGSK